MTPLDPPSSLAIKALAGALPTTDKSSVPIKWIVTCLLAILDDTADGEPENEKLRIVLAKLLEPSAKFKVPTVSPTSFSHAITDFMLRQVDGRRPQDRRSLQDLPAEVRLGQSPRRSVDSELRTPHPAEITKYATLSSYVARVTH